MIWGALTAELDRWHEAGRVASFWLRDDDATVPTTALDLLLEGARRHGVPVTLAVIPQPTDRALADRLQDLDTISVLVHGWSHHNHAPGGKKKQELGVERPRCDVFDTLRQGFEKLSGLHASRFVPVLVPPWNRIDPSLLPDLASLGYRALSVFGPEKPEAIPCVNTHVDVMDWHGTRGGRPADRLVEEIIARLRHQFAQGGSMGLLTHHLVHDAAVWTFLEDLFAATTSHPGCRWVGLPFLLPK